MNSGFVALVGWTNVGKSTLLNRLVGEKVAAVSPVPQTTRNRIMGVLPVTGKGQIVFLDTPGFHKPRHKMNRNMVEVARETLRGVDLVIQVVDASRGVARGDRDTARLLTEAGTARLAVLNKVDVVEPKAELLPMMSVLVEELGFLEVVPVSALTGEGCDVLVERVLARLPEGPAPFADDVLTDQPERVLAAEFIREKLLQRTRQEVPHALAVVVERWKEPPGGPVRIDAVILVEREGQKGIVIGRGGSLLKQVGTEARAEIERLLGTPVHLELWVKVRRDWRDDDRTLRELGLS